MATKLDRRGLQSGIYLSPADRPPPAFLFVVVDIVDGTDRGAARGAVRQLTDMLVDLQRGVVRDLIGTRDGETGEIITLRTFDFLLGFGAQFFDAERQLTELKRPELLAPLTHPGRPFPGIGWDSGVAVRSGEGDICLQFTGRDEHAVSRAVVESWKLIMDEGLPLRIRETFAGFARDDGRSWIGFHDGVSNIRPSQRLAAVECTGDPEWNRGGTYLAFLRCGVDLLAWRGLTREAQEMLIGRDKLSGCALEAIVEQDGGLQSRVFASCPATSGGGAQENEAFRDPPETGDQIIEASHVHRANQNRAEPSTNASHRIFRQGYEYLDGFGSDDPRLGLNFISFQRDLEHLRQILGLPGWLGGVNFGGRSNRGRDEPEPLELISLLAGGFYAIPAREKPFPGATLFAP